MDPDFKTATPKSTPKFSKYMNEQNNYGTYNSKRDILQVQFHSDEDLDKNDSGKIFKIFIPKEM